MHGFWKNWMTAWCWGAMAFGAALVTAALPGADAPARMILDLLSSDHAGAALLDTPAFRFAFGLQGALTIGWALTMFGMIGAAETGGAPVWRALTFSLLVWYVIDSAISMTTGFPLNAVSNTVLMVTYLAPIFGSGVLGAGARRAVA